MNSQFLIREPNEVVRFPASVGLYLGVCLYVCVCMWLVYLFAVWFPGFPIFSSE